MEPRKQEYVKSVPKLGDLFAFAWGYTLCPAVLVGFNPRGGWQIVLLDYKQHRPIKFRKHGVMERHNRRIMRMDVADLDTDQKKEYDSVLNQLKQ